MCREEYVHLCDTQVILTSALQMRLWMTLNIVYFKLKPFFKAYPACICVMQLKSEVVPDVRSV